MSELFWSPTTLAIVDDAADMRTADDGVSQYAAYIAQHPDWFRGYNDEPLSPAEFAAAAWRTATGPVMSPGYVRIRPDLGAITADVDEGEPDLLVLSVTVRLHHRDLAGRPSYRWQDWQRADLYGAADARFGQLAEPEQPTPAVLAIAVVRVSVLPGDLPAPRNTRGIGLLRDAQAAVRTVAEVVNLRAGNAVSTLLHHAPARV